MCNYLKLYAQLFCFGMFPAPSAAFNPWVSPLSR